MSDGPSRQRSRLHWVPKWEGLIEAWAKKFIRQNQWRCDNIHDFDDLLQDSYLIYLKITERYPRVTDPPHFMALYRTALWNHFHDHARYVRRKRLVQEEVNDEAIFTTASTDHQYGPILAALTKAPQEVQQALILLQTKPELVRTTVPGVRENLNMKLWRILGLGQQRTPSGRVRPRLRVDIMGALETILT